MSIAEFIDEALLDIVSTAFILSQNPKRRSPFTASYEAHIDEQVSQDPRFFGMPATALESFLAKYKVQGLGGKPDDITVTLSIVTDSVIEPRIE